MDKLEIQSEWVKALRSGRYTQTQKKLRDSSGFCCLGVLCEVLTAHGIVKRDDEGYCFDAEEDGIKEMQTSLYTPVLRLTGLTGDQQGTLMSMNDGADEFDRHTFEQIADYIEREIMGAK